MKQQTILLFLSASLLAACSGGNTDFDAAGSFESVETVISTEASGSLLRFAVEEGQILRVGEEIGYVDSTQLYLRKQQLEAQITSTTSQRPDIPVQVASLKAQLAEAEKNQQRVNNLAKADAATQQQQDDANSRVEVIRTQIEAQQSALGITSNTLSKTVLPLERQIEQLNDQLAKCHIINPVKGTVLTKYAQAHEIVQPGKALYKIAPTDTLILRAYLTGAQLSQIKLGQSVKVRTDKGAKQYGNYNGTVCWISDKSEFTPKTIPTKEERADLVYAIKIRVPNDGYLKIGMYGEVNLK